MVYMIKNLNNVLSIIKALRSSDEEATKEALRCVANALLLISEGRSVWAEIHGADYCIDIFRVCIVFIEGALFNLIHCLDNHFP